MTRGAHRRRGRLGAEEIARRVEDRQRRLKGTLRAIRAHGLTRQYFARLEGHSAALEELTTELRRRLRATELTPPAELAELQLAHRRSGVAV